MWETINSRKHLKDVIVQALQDSAIQYEGYYYLSLEKKMMCVCMDGMSDNSTEDSKEEDRVRIDPLPSHVAFGCMEEFAGQLKDTGKQQHLLRALKRRKPFSSFRYAANDVGLLEDWLTWRERWYDEKAEAWMRIHGVDFEDGKLKALSAEPFCFRNASATEAPARNNGDGDRHASSAPTENCTTEQDNI